MSINTPRNKEFVEAYRDRFGEYRVTSDPIEAGYFGVHMWAQAVEQVGTTDLDKVREALRGLTFEAPGGLVKIDPVNNHTWKSAHVGRVMPDGQFDILWTSPAWIQPDPFPALVSNKEVLEPGKVRERK